MLIHPGHAAGGSNNEVRTTALRIHFARGEYMARRVAGHSTNGQLGHLIYRKNKNSFQEESALVLSDNQGVRAENQ